MINEVLLRTRNSDGKKIYTRFSTSYIESGTHKFYSEIPEGRTETDFATSFYTKVRCDQTGVIYDTAHDVEDAPYTYTEVFPDPNPTEFIETGTGTSSLQIRVSYDKYKTYNKTETYAKGDIRTYSGKTYISELDDNLGNDPKIYGWDEYLPYVETRKPEYKTLEEWGIA